jgi:hypothetical protein
MAAGTYNRPCYYCFHAYETLLHGRSYKRIFYYISGTTRNHFQTRKWKAGAGIEVESGILKPGDGDGVFVWEMGYPRACVLSGIATNFLRWKSKMAEKPRPYVVTECRRILRAKRPTQHARRASRSPTPRKSVCRYTPPPTVPTHLNF